MKITEICDAYSGYCEKPITYIPTISDGHTVDILPQTGFVVGDLIMIALAFVILGLAILWAARLNK